MRNTKPWLSSSIAIGSTVLLLAGCGRSDGMATVKLVTGLEDNLKPINLMSVISTQPHLLFSGATSCAQTQVFSAFGPHTNGGNQALTTGTVSLITPTTDGTATTINAMVGGPGAWLQSSCLSPVTVTVPVGQLLDFGIGGAITPATATAVGADGTCPLIDPGSNTPFPSFSLLGHTRATITGNTTLPINIYITDAQPAGIAAFPYDPGGICDQQNQNNNDQDNSQQCPDGNFVQLILQSCTGSTPCNNALVSGGYLSIKSFISTGGAQVSTQYVKLANATSATGVIIADISPFVFGVYNNTNTLVETGSYNNNNGNNNGSMTGSTPSPTPYFTDGITYAQVNEGSGQLPPGNFNLYNIMLSPPPPSAPTTINFSWNGSNGVNSYSLVQNAGGTLNCMTAPTILNSTNQSASVNIGATCILVGQMNTFQMIATGLNGKTTLSQPVQVPMPPGGFNLNAINQTPTGGPNGAITLTWTTSSGAATYEVQTSPAANFNTCTNGIVGLTYTDINCFLLGAPTNYQIVAHAADGAIINTIPASVLAIGQGAITTAPGITGQIVINNLTSMIGATTFNVYYGTTFGTYPTFGCTTGAATCTVTGLTSASTYFFQVRATNTQGGSLYSTANISQVAP